MGWLLDNMKALEDFETTKISRERTAKEDAYREEERALLRQQREDKSKADEFASGEMTKMLDGAQAQGDDPLANYRAPVKPVVGQPGVPGSAPEAYQDPNRPNGVQTTPGAPAYVPPKMTYLDNAVAAHTSAAKIAQANKDFTGFKAAYDGLSKLRIQKDVAQIMDWTQNASADELKAATSQVSLDPSNDYRMETGKDGLSTIVEVGGAQANLNREQLGQFLAAKYRITRGDTAALGDIAAINKGLAEQVAGKLGIQMDIAKTNNDVAAKRHAMQIRDMAAARQGGGGGGSRGGSSRGGGEQEFGPIDYSKGVKFNDVYQKNLSFQLDRLKGDPMAGNAPVTKEQADQAARAAYDMTAQQLGAIESSSRKSTQESAIHQVLGPLRSGRGANPSEYAGRRAQLIDRGYSDAELTAMGYPRNANEFSVVKNGKMISRGTSAR